MVAAVRGSGRFLEGQADPCPVCTPNQSRVLPGRRTVRQADGQPDGVPGRS